MSLTLVATPIGNDKDISLHALEILKNSEIIILEEFKESSRILRSHKINEEKKIRYEQLNEHSSDEDISRLAELCEKHHVALITDCGTPGFCDPGALLVAKCRQKKISIKTLPGASSLMGLLSLSSQRIDQFIFRGFIPADNEERDKAWKNLALEKNAFVIMDTPYRFQKMLQEIKEHLPARKILLTLNLTQESEQILEGTADYILKQNLPNKAEFMILIYADKTKSQSENLFSRSAPNGRRAPRRSSNEPSTGFKIGSKPQSSSFKKKK